MVFRSLEFSELNITRQRIDKANPLIPLLHAFRSGGAALIVFINLEGARKNWKTLFNRLRVGFVSFEKVQKVS